MTCRSSCCHGKPSSLDWLKQQKAAGREIILATASNRKYAQQIADHLGIFDRVVASDAQNNLSGSNKLRWLQNELGEQEFVYAANAPVDLKVWEHAKAAVVVNPGSGVADAAARVTAIEESFDDRVPLSRAFIRAIRAHQWLKNFLLFVPLVLAHKLGDLQLVLQSMLAFMAFCLCASSVYLLNDLLDLPMDRQHPRKSKRPFASGDLPLFFGMGAMVVFLLLAFGIALLLPIEFFFVLVGYYFLTIAYSAVLKRAAVIDVLVLAALYTLRLIAGAAAISVEPSFWLLAFSMFTFLSLALMKRYSELLLQAELGKNRLAGRAYRFVDLETLAQMGSASGYLAVMVLALYIDSDQVMEMYSWPVALWLLCPMMLYWISRLWLLARRGDMHDDPVVFTIRDQRTYWLALVAGCALWAAL